jgi:hypothetical protein
MLISGFTIIRNAEIMDYPVVPAIRSILPIVDEFVDRRSQDPDLRQLLGHDPQERRRHHGRKDQ